MPISAKLLDTEDELVINVEGRFDFSAHQEFRSVNAQIEFLLRDAVMRRKGGARTAPPQVDSQDPSGEAE